MIIDLNVLRGHSKNFDVSFGPDEIKLEIDGVRMSTPATMSAEIACDDVRTHVTGKILAEFEIDCTRCLEAVSVPMQFDFDVEFVDAEHFVSSGEHEIDTKDLSADALAGEQFDLNELAREQILLNLPEQVFCKEDCKGLCGICGTNRNLGDCNCTDAEIDPRWSVLKDLK